VIVCLVTDRRRLSTQDESSVDTVRHGLVEQLRAAIEAGIDLVQVRGRELEARDLLTIATDAVQLARGTGTRVIVNDRLDVALASGAHGVHLGGGSISAADVRRLVPPGFLVGRSVHAVAEAIAAGPVDYLVAGTVFATVSKVGNYHLMGLEGLRAVVSAVSVPVLAIGGVTVENVEQIAGTGAAGIAAIGLFVGDEPLGPVVKAVRRRFDTVNSAP
jgi:thiamine-phosphate pyrophosphorylase